ARRATIPPSPAPRWRRWRRDPPVAYRSAPAPPGPPARWRAGAPARPVPAPPRRTCSACPFAMPPPRRGPPRRFPPRRPPFHRTRIRCRGCALLSQYRYPKTAPALGLGSLLDERLRDVSRFLDAPVAPDARAQAEPVHDAAHMVRIVAHPEAPVDGLPETQGRPAIALETSLSRAGMVDLGSAVELFRVQSAGTAGRAPFPQRFHALDAQRAAPARRRGAAHAEFAGDLGLRESRLQVLCG